MAMAELDEELDDGFGVDEDDAEPLFADDLDDLPPLAPPMPPLSQIRANNTSTVVLPPIASQAGPGAVGGPGDVEGPGAVGGPGGGDQGPPVKKRKPILTLTTDRIFLDKGLPYLESEFPKLKFKGKGHETSDLKFLMKQYEMWANRLYPKYTFKDVLKRIERLSTTKEFKSQLFTMRRRHGPHGGPGSPSPANATPEGSPSPANGCAGSPPPANGHDTPPDGSPPRANGHAGSSSPANGHATLPDGYGHATSRSPAWHATPSLPDPSQAVSDPSQTVPDPTPLDGDDSVDVPGHDTWGSDREDYDAMEYSNGPEDSPPLHGDVRPVDSSPLHDTRGSDGEGTEDSNVRPDDSLLHNTRGRDGENSDVMEYSDVRPNDSSPFHDTRGSDGEGTEDSIVRPDDSARPSSYLPPHTYEDTLT